jgi:lactate dehydrogenase-like 2-hydroxyacid dehydrogenase
MTATPHVFVSRALPGQAINDLHQLASVRVWEHDEPPTVDEFYAAVAPCTSIVATITERIDGDLLDHAPALVHVSNVAVGYDNIDVAACTKRGVMVTNTPGVLTGATADLTMALLLAVARRLPQAAAAVRSGEWGRWHPTWMCGLELSGATLGVVGYGAVGRAVAARAEAFGMTIVHHDPGDAQSASLDHVFRTSDVVSLHCPLTESTHHLVDADRLHSMKPEAILINTSRGGVVDTDALVEALRDGTIAAAGLDVTESEPLDPNHDLLHLDNCLVLPHIGSATIATRTKMADLAVEQAWQVLRNEIPTHLVNPDVLRIARS